MTAGAREECLDVHRTLEVSIRHRYADVGQRSAMPDSDVLIVVSRAEQHLQIHYGTGAGVTRLDDRAESLLYGAVPHPG